MKKLYFFFLFALALVGCSSEDEVTFHNAELYYDNSDSKNYVLVDVYKGRPTKVEVLDLNSSLDTVSTTTVSVDSISVNLYDSTKMEGIAFTVEDFTTPYKIVRVTPVDEDGDKTDNPSMCLMVSNEFFHDKKRYYVTKVNSLRQKRIVQLVKDGYPLSAAQSVARAEMKTVFNIQSEDQYTKLSDLIDDDYVDAFSEDFRDGSIEDTLALVKIADNVLANYIAGSSADEIRDFYEHVVEKFLGLDSCKDYGQKQVIDNVLSAYHKDSVLCDSTNLLYHRLYDEYDYAWGICSEERKGSFMCDADSACFECRWGRWLPAISKDDWISHYYYACDSSTRGDLIYRGDSVFVCSYYNEWELQKVDSLGRAFGECTEDRLWEIQEFRDGKNYSCTDKYEWALTTAGYYLKSLRPCEYDVDDFRVEMYVAKTNSSSDTTYYHCAAYGPDALNNGFLEASEDYAKMLMESTRLMEEEECTKDIYGKKVYSDELRIYFVCRTWDDGYHWYKADD